MEELIACVLDDEMPAIRMYGRNWNIRHCIREVRASIMQPILPMTMENANATRYAHAEQEHWKDVMRCHEELYQSTQTDNTNINHDSNNNNKYLDASHILNLLGPHIQAQISDLSNLPAADDHAGAWQLFGAHCQCRQSYKETLMYCHCIATKEALDPNLIFRDAVLNQLLQLEQDT